MRTCVRVCGRRSVYVERQNTTHAARACYKCSKEMKVQIPVCSSKGVKRARTAKMKKNSRKVFTQTSHVCACLLRLNGIRERQECPMQAHVTHACMQARQQQRQGKAQAGTKARKEKITQPPSSHSNKQIQTKQHRCKQTNTNNHPGMRCNASACMHKNAHTCKQTHNVQGTHEMEI